MCVALKFLCTLQVGTVQEEETCRSYYCFVAGWVILWENGLFKATLLYRLFVVILVVDGRGGGLIPSLLHFCLFISV